MSHPPGSPRLLDADDVADLVLPLDGPYDRAGLAAAVAAELVRRLNHGTMHDQAVQSMPYPSNVDNVVMNLHLAVSRLPQLLAQLDRRLNRFVGATGLYSDMEVRDEWGGVLTPDGVAIEAQRRLQEAAQHASAAADALSRARKLTARLGVRTPPEDDQE